jgi:hypothetical protein
MSDAATAANPRRGWLRRYLNMTFARQPAPDPRAALAVEARQSLSAADEFLQKNEPERAAALLRDLGPAMSSPLLRPPPDDRPEEVPDPAARDALAAQMAAERRALLQDWEGMLRRCEHQLPDREARDAVSRTAAMAQRELLLCDVPQRDPLRAALFKAPVAQALEAIASRLDAVVAPERKAAVLAKLGGTLTELIDPMVAEALWSYQGRPDAQGQTEGSYATIMEELLRQEGRPLSAHAPGLQQRIELETANFRASVEEVLDRVVADKPEISAEMFGGAAIGGLTDLAVTGSDPHNGGRRVMILSFEGTGDAPLKVVHKPRDLRVDARIVGRTGQQGVAASLSERANALMLAAEHDRLQNLADQPEWAPQQAEGLLDVVTDPDTGEVATAEFHGERVPELTDRNVTLLPTYGFVEKQDGKGRYGWVEFVEHGRQEDCVLDRPAAEAFYRCAGQLAGLAFLCGLEDLHQGNLLVRDGLPVLTDLEIAFGSKAEPPAGFDPLTASDEELAAYIRRQLDKTLLAGALGQGTETQHLAASVKDDGMHRFPLSKVETTDNAVFLRNEDRSLRAQTEGLAREFADSFSDGFRRIRDVFGDPALQAENEAFLDGFNGMDVRYHALATGQQLQLRRGAMMEGYKGTIKEEADNLTRKILPTESYFAPRVRQAPWLQAVVPKVAEDLAHRDVAYFTQCLGTRELKHNGRGPIEHEDSTALLPHDGLAAARRNLQVMVHRGAILQQEADALVRRIPAPGQLPEMEALKERYRQP